MDVKVTSVETREVLDFRMEELSHVARLLGEDGQRAERHPAMCTTGQSLNGPRSEGRRAPRN